MMGLEWISRSIARSSSLPTSIRRSPFRGFGRLLWVADGVPAAERRDLFVTFSAGYWHASWPTPWDIPPEAMAALETAGPVLATWTGHAPDGGRMMWIRSRDDGKTWSRPRSFPWCVARM